VFHFTDPKVTCTLYTHLGWSVLYSISSASYTFLRRYGVWLTQLQLLYISCKSELNMTSFCLPAYISRRKHESQWNLTLLNKIFTFFTVDSANKKFTFSGMHCVVSQESLLFGGKNKKQTPWPLVRKRTIPTDDRHLSAKFSANFCG
jgi:hypothetical protein